MDCTSRSCRCNILITVSSPSVVTQWSLTTHCLKNFVLSWMSKTHGPLSMRVTVCSGRVPQAWTKEQTGTKGTPPSLGVREGFGQDGSRGRDCEVEWGPRPHETAATPEAERVSERGCHTLGGRRDVAERRAKHQPMGV